MKNLNDSLNKLFPRKKNFVRNSLSVNMIDDMSIFAPFKHCSFKRSAIFESIFSQCELNYSAWAESNFYKVDFRNCTFNGTNMQLCVFDKCVFTGNAKYTNISFCNSLFKNSRFENVIFNNCTLTDTTFLSCSFINCKFQSSSFDGTKFIDCNFERLIARNMNLDYSQYRNCIFNNSQISLFQISYTIGLLQCVAQNSNNEFAFQGRTIPSSVFYNEYVDYLCDYFESRNDLYPLSNLYFFLDKLNAKEYIISGIKEAIIKQKYRLVIHFCELINYYNCLKSSEKRELIAFLNLSISTFALNENIAETLKYSVLIENYLLKNYDNIPLFNISIQTDYNVEASEQLDELISDLDNLLVLEQGLSGEHNITITHNSPLWFDIVLAIGGSIVGAYIKEEIIDRLIAKLKELFKNRKIKIKKITIKGSDKSGGKIIEKTDDNE